MNGRFQDTCEAYLGVAGQPGLTVYVGLLKVAGLKRLRRGGGGGLGRVPDRQIKGAVVIGSAGCPDKCAYPREIGVDHVVDYKAEPDLTAALARAAPDGIDA